jgi:hypothetical protein
VTLPATLPARCLFSPSISIRAKIPRTFDAHVDYDTQWGT